MQFATEAQKKVYDKVAGILRGYGEADPASSADSGFLSAVAALRAEYYDVRDVLIDREIPRDLSVLILPGPRTPIPAEAAAKLSSWFEAGGRALVLL